MASQSNVKRKLKRNVTDDVLIQQPDFYGNYKVYDEAFEKEQQEELYHM